jgi:ABC-type hemin transport system substrate-binding protein
MKSSFRLPVLSSQSTKILFCFIFPVVFHMLPVTAVHAELPDRIVSLAPSTTEILFAMGLGNRIVGVTNFCDYPEKAKKKSKTETEVINRDGYWFLDIKDFRVI